MEWLILLFVLVLCWKGLGVALGFTYHFAVGFFGAFALIILIFIVLPIMAIAFS